MQTTIRMGKITILLVDDHKLIRDSWSFILNSDSRFQVIGETSNADEAVEISKDKKPEIVLMDINMTPVNGFEATKLVRKYSPGSKVIGISMHSMPAYARRMLQLGAMGYVTKNSSKDELLTAIVEVHNGKKYICDEVKNILAQQELEEEGGPPDMNVLSRREIEIVQLIKEGLSSKEIALRLDISLKTVEVHRYNILKKLSLKNTAALVNFINAHGL
ncbi:MAG TPA: response regulator transcription factor [Chitinophagaceae bacterium]|nr:response regulator transcription factor [Chitinophagaceae bacterium]HQV84328.1 response regulator transcription factor [Chitinophagaceae bacterium]HQX71580.1 response regulator transcription factor [Chitinophagaceae bacterium]HQZ74554.1 response regulator transcription factor [Chitinophagaceae bacterium]